MTSLSASEKVQLTAELLDALCAALPFVEDALTSEDFKPGYVKQRAALIRAAIAKASALYFPPSNLNS